MPRTKAQFAKTNDISIAYRSVGTQLAASSVDSAMIAAACGAETEFMMALGDPSMGTSAVLVDLRGTGGSDKPDDVQQYTIGSYTQDMFSVAESIGATNPTLLGYSHFAAVAAQAALSEPSRVSALILVEPAFFIDKEVYERRIRALEQGDMEGALRMTFKFANPKISEQQLSRGVKVAMDYYGNNPASLLGEFRARANSDLTEARLGEIRVPTLVIGGTKSNLASNVARTARSIPNASMVWIPGADHFLMDHDNQVARVISAFLGLAKNNKSTSTKGK
ncbi:MAG TPA: alpha/beta hydrolase [Allosphingosinicella sp.]|nr:alpha/beta hydrolase [Allosphingosinicella sp.]